MREILSALDIAASPDRVWQVLTDFGNYPRWNPFIRGILADKLVAGARLRVRMRISPGGRAWEFSPTILNATPGAELRWVGRFLVPGLFDGEHAFIIVPQGLEGSRFIQRERFSGLLAGAVFRHIETDVRRSFDEMNLALKRIAET